jgi:hypothetical protein
MTLMKFKILLMLVCAFLTGPCDAGLTAAKRFLAIRPTSTSTNLTAPGATHTTDQCTGAGGAVVTGGGFTMCRFNAASCPGGWSSYLNWSTTTSNSSTVNQAGITCSYAQASCKGNSPPSIVVPSGSQLLTTGSHAWSSATTETSMCRSPGSCYDQRNASCDDAAYSFDGITSINGSGFCGVWLVNTMEQVRVTNGVQNIGAYVQLFTNTNTISAVVTQIGCK